MTKCLQCLDIVLMHQSFEPPSPWAWQGHSLSVIVKASQVPRHREKVKSPSLGTPCVELSVTAFLKSSHQTLKSISKSRKHECELRK